MATFAQRQSRQFNPYVPEVDTQAYAQALAKKDQDYKIGTSKVEAYRNSIAGLPVAFEHERKYLQGVTDELTSQVNNMVGADWSDQKLVNQVATQASTIYNDPNIQTMIGNAAHKKQQDSNLQEDTKSSKGKNESNKSDYYDHLRDFTNRGQVGESFDYNYFTHADYKDEFSKYYKDKHPNSSIVFKEGGVDPKTGKYNPSLAAQEWDYTQAKYKEISPAQVREDWDNFVKSDPSFQKQIDIDANFEYRALDNNSFAKVASSQYQDIINTNRRAHDEASKQLDLMKPDDPKRQSVENNKNIAEANILDAQNFMSYISANPEQVGEDVKKKTFRDNLSNMMAKRYSYLDMEDFQVGKTSPWEKQHVLQQMSNDNYYKSENLKIAKKAQEIREKELDLKEQAAVAKQRKMNTPVGGFVNQGGSTKEPLSYHEEFEKQTQDLAHEILSKKNQFTFDQFGVEHPEWFRDGIPTKSGMVELNKRYNELSDKFKSGNTKDFDLPTLEYFNNNYEDNKLWEAKNKALKESGKQWTDRLTNLAKDDPEYNSLLNHYNDLVGKYYGNSPHPSFTNNIDRTVQAIVERSNLSEKVKSATEQAALDQRIAEKYGFDNLADLQKSQRDLTSNSDLRDMFNTYTRLHMKSSDDENNFKDDFFKSKNYLLQNQYQPIFKPKETRESIVHTLEPYTTGNKEAQRFLAHKDVTAGVVQDIGTGKYNLVLKLGSEELPIEIPANEAVNLGAKDLRMDDYISQVLRTNMNQIAHASSTYANGTQKGSFSDAEPLFNDGKVDYRYGIRQVGGKYYVEFWQKNPNDPTDKGILYKDKNGKDVVGVSTDLTDIKNMINNFKQTSNVKPTGEYYSFDEESATDNNNNDNTLNQ